MADFGLEGWKKRNSKLEGCSQEGIYAPQNGNDSQMAQFQRPLTNYAVCNLVFKYNFLLFFTLYKVALKNFKSLPITGI